MLGLTSRTGDERVMASIGRGSGGAAAEKSVRIRGRRAQPRAQESVAKGTDQWNPCETWTT